MKIQEGAPTAEQLQQEWNSVASEREGADKSPPEGQANGTGANEQTAAAAESTTSVATTPKEPTTAELLAEINSMKEVNKAAMEELKRTSGRVSALQSQLALGQKAAKAVGDAPDKAQQAEAAKDPQEWEELKRDFPEWGVAVEKLLGARLQATLSKIPAQQNAAPALDEAALAAHVQNSLAQREVARIERVHKGWSQTVNTAEFQAWQAKQPDAVKALGQSDYAEDAIEMLNLFEQSKKTADQAQTIQQSRQKKLDAAANGNPGKAAAAATSSGGELTAKEIWDLEAKKREDKKRKQG